MRELEQKTARLNRIKERIANLKKEHGRLEADIQSIQHAMNRRRRLTALVRAGLLVERAGLLDECQTDAFMTYLLNFKFYRGDAHGD